MHVAVKLGGLALAASAFIGPAVWAQEIDEQQLIERVHEIRDSDTAAWKKIPWVASIAEARRLSRQEHCPVFLFSHDGNLETGRC
jgi:hypothetical protein